MSGLRALARVAAVALMAACATACGVEEPTLEDEAVASSSESAYSGTLTSLDQIRRPAGSPASWAQPDSTGAFGQNGYCGATAAANLLRWYGREVSPQNAIDNGCWSYIGTRPSTLGAYFQNHHPDLGCRYERLDWDADALGTIRSSLASGRPMVVEFMTGRLDAHWVTVIGVQGTGDDPKLVVMSWGGYYTTQWSTFGNTWRNAWGGYYPHITCDAVSPLASALRVQR